jgi:hypothetical protein
MPPPMPFSTAVDRYWSGDAQEAAARRVVTVLGTA